jgi:hypothetical protein
VYLAHTLRPALLGTRQAVRPVLKTSAKNDVGQALRTPPGPCLCPVARYWRDEIVDDGIDATVLHGRYITSFDLTR